MNALPRIAILIDLPRGESAGGHVVYWENIARAVAQAPPAVDLTFYFSGKGDDDILAPHVRYRYLSPLLSTEKLKFLPYLPAHTDLAPFHPRLAHELPDYDVIHTTDAFFAFAKTAQRIARWYNIPLITSLHTDTPAYAEIFTRSTLENIFGHTMGSWLDKKFKFGVHSRASKNKQLAAHMRGCAAIMAMRDDDVELAQSLTAPDKVKRFRLAVDKDLFAPNKNARTAIAEKYNIPSDRFIVLFVGRVDIGKNMPLLMDVCAGLIARNIHLHLLVVGQGPLMDDVKKTLGDNVTLTGQLPHHELASCYAGAGCLALVSDVEIGGLVALEAMSCGCPVLVSESSHVAQAAGATNVMQIVDSNYAAWAVAIAVLAESRGKQARMQADSLTYREQKLANWQDIVAHDFIPVWQSVGKE